MTDTLPLLKTNRILITLDSSPRGRAALDAALQLAMNTSAELQGLFVEDEDLVRLASLPFSREVDFASASSQKLHSAHMEHALRTAGEEAQRAFVKALQQLNLHWTFRVVRGTVTQTSLAAAADVDLLVIGQQGRSPRIISGAYLPKRSLNATRVVAIFDGTPSAFRAIELANDLAKDSPILVLVLANTGNEVASQCRSWLEAKNLRAELDQALNPTQDTVIDYVKKWSPSVLVINRDSAFINDSQICRLVNEFECPLILC